MLQILAIHDKSYTGKYKTVIKYLQCTGHTKIHSMYSFISLQNMQSHSCTTKHFLSLEGTSFGKALEKILINFCTIAVHVKKHIYKSNHILFPQQSTYRQFDIIACDLIVSFILLSSRYIHIL